MSVTRIEFIDSQHDTLLVSVFNECDTCIQHVYTGLIAFHNQDTIAIDEYLTSRQTPLNNEESDYRLISSRIFEISDVDKIEMIYICDSLPFSSVLHINENKNRKLHSFILYQNYPNPFNPETTVDFEIDKSADIKLFIYNLNGQLIKKLVREQLTPGKYSRNWNGTDQLGKEVSSGLYIYQLTVDNFIESKKLLLLK